MGTKVRHAVIAAFLTAAVAMIGADAPDPTLQLPPVRHVFVIALENASYAQSYGAGSKYPYLAQTLRSRGMLLRQYYGTAHYSAGNYLAILGGVAPTIDIQNDCTSYNPMVNPSPAPYGQVKAAGGCIYPSTVPTLTGQLTSRGLTWKGYMEDVGNVSGREERTCGKPTLDPDYADLTQNAVKGDAYAARHNPFLYFGSIVNTPACAANVGPLTLLPQDLVSITTTPNLSFISPSLCNDGHDQTCDGQPAGPAAEDTWLRTWIPLITSSPAFQKDGAIFIVNDEAGGDSSACCQEPSGPNVAYPGAPPAALNDKTFAGSQGGGKGGGKGGGRIGALILSPFVHPGTTSTTPYNHYSLLKSIENLFSLPHIGYAGQPGLRAFSTDVWSRSRSDSHG